MTHSFSFFSGPNKKEGEKKRGDEWILFKDPPLLKKKQGEKREGMGHGHYVVNSV